MIGNSVTENLGGPVLVEAILLSNVQRVRTLKRQISVVLKSGKSFEKFYHSYKSLSVLTEEQQGNSSLYKHTIKFRIPRETFSLTSSIDAFVGNPVMLKVTFSSGVVKVYGTFDFPVYLSYVPTLQDSPSSYNGVEVTCQGLSTQSGWFLV